MYEEATLVVTFFLFFVSLRFAQYMLRYLRAFVAEIRRYDLYSYQPQSAMTR